ncbi:hypothetical protein PG988_011468 [Apiospora saccharicola]
MGISLQVDTGLIGIEFCHFHWYDQGQVGDRIGAQVLEFGAVLHDQLVNHPAEAERADPPPKTRADGEAVEIVALVVLGVEHRQGAQGRERDVADLDDGCVVPRRRALPELGLVQARQVDLANLGAGLERVQVDRHRVRQVLQDDSRPSVCVGP